MIKIMSYCSQLNAEINKKFQRIMRRNAMGGSLIGNVNIRLGNKGQLIWDT